MRGRTGVGSPVFLTAEWRDLVLLNFEVEAAALAARVPAGTELDSFRGKTLVSLVGFRFLRTRVLRVALPLHTRFEEVNLRFYVRRRVTGGAPGAAETRRGVVFVRELVPRPAIAWAARTLYHEPYLALRMRHRTSLPAGPVAYSWRWGGRWHRLEAWVRGAPSLPAAGSEAEFITEHYWGYTAQPDGSTLEYRVEHPRWQVWPAASSELELAAGAARALYGEELAPFLARPPVSAFVAVGSPVAVHRARALA